jgi:hypothetical protein
MKPEYELVWRFYECSAAAPAEGIEGQRRPARRIEPHRIVTGLHEQTVTRRKRNTIKSRRAIPTATGEESDKHTTQASAAASPAKHAS